MVHSQLLNFFQTVTNTPAHMFKSSYPSSYVQKLIPNEPSPSELVIYQVLVCWDLRMASSGLSYFTKDWSFLHLTVQFTKLWWLGSLLFRFNEVHIWWSGAAAGCCMCESLQTRLPKMAPAFTCQTVLIGFRV